MTTKKRISRVVAVALALCLVAALAVPSFAAEPRAATGPWYFQNAGSSAHVLNIYRTYSGNLQASYENVTVHPLLYSADQRWIKAVEQGSVGTVTSEVKGIGGVSISLNCAPQGNCIVFSSAGNEFDSLASYENLAIKLVNRHTYGDYLTSAGAYGNVRWSSFQDNLSRWSAR